jgi:hypothetical protein
MIAVVAFLRLQGLFGQLSLLPFAALVSLKYEK